MGICLIRVANKTGLLFQQSGFSVRNMFSLALCEYSSDSLLRNIMRVEAIDSAAVDHRYTRAVNGSRIIGSAAEDRLERGKSALFRDFIDESEESEHRFVFLQRSQIRFLPVHGRLRSRNHGPGRELLDAGFDALVEQAFLGF